MIFTTMRDESLDSLRGIAIFGMVLSGSIASGILPAWMYHAQVPLARGFDPSIFGITWVDLVFPFFLFAMGMAIPLALHKKIEQKSIHSLLPSILQRYGLILYFSFMFQSLHPWSLPSDLGSWKYCISLTAFVLMGLLFARQSLFKHKKIAKFVGILSFVFSVILLWVLNDYSIITMVDNNGNFVLKSNIIFNVLANTYLFGSIVWLITRNRLHLKIWFLILLFAILITPNPESGFSWQYCIKNFPRELPTLDSDILKTFYSFIGAIYNFTWLKYLFLVVIGSVIGEIYLHSPKFNLSTPILSVSEKKNLNITLIIAFLFIPLNLWGLFSRHLLINLLLNIGLFTTLYFVVKPKLESRFTYIHSLIKWAIVMLSIGLFLEAYEGGIRKDHSTFSYYFVTCGLAIFMLLTFYIANLLLYSKKITNFFADLGKNPMLAYCVSGLFIFPVLHFTHLQTFIDFITAQGNTLFTEGHLIVAGILGLLRGVLLTSLMSVVTILFVRYQWFWKT